MKPYAEIIEHYRKDPVLYEAISALDIEIRPELNIDIYESLLNSIVSQQLSIKVVRIIWKRFTDLFVDGYPDANQLLTIDHRIMRKVGLSNSKANYLKNVAEFKLCNDMSFEYLQAMTDQEIIDYLTQIKGVGKWTVQMILMFPMDRPNVFPVDDLGIQNVMKGLYGLEMERRELRQTLIEIADRWHPYKSLASKYIWEIGGI
jgi:DNA-3-methyladenine glycosylase II